MYEGILVGMILMGMLSSALYLGFNMGKKDVSHVPDEDKKYDDELQKMIRKREEGFQNILNYDVNVAIGKGVDHE